MDLLHTILLALVQGLTEFLPISSAAHLILVPVLTAWEDQGLAFDVAVHVGTLVAVVVYFRHELARMALEWGGSLAGRGLTPDARLAWAVLIGTLPAGLAGLLLKDFVEGPLRSPLVIAAATIVFALLLWWADTRGRQRRDEHQLGWADVLFIGCAQAIALIPGTSRSGITMTAGLLLGLTREASARYSFLLSVPIIVLAGGWQTVKLLGAAQPVDWTILLVGTGVSAVSAYLCIHFFLRLIARMGMLPFVIYRLLLGAVLLYLLA